LFGAICLVLPAVAVFAEAPPSGPAAQQQDRATPAVNPAPPAPQPPDFPRPPSTIGFGPSGMPSYGPAAIPPGSGEGLVTKIYPLNFAEPEYLSTTLSQIPFESKPIYCVPEPNTLAVIVTAAPEQFKAVEEFIKKLDVPERTREIRVYRLKNALVTETSKVLQTLLQGVSFAMDQRTNSLLASGDPAQMQVTEQLIQQLDSVTAGPGAESRRIRFVWLVSIPTLSPAPPDLQDVLEELQVIGVRDLRLAAQHIVETTAGDQFQTQSTPAAFDSCRLKIEGKLEQTRTQPPRLEVALTATGLVPKTDPDAPSAPPAPRPSMPQPPENLATLRTTIVAPPGHKVVLGVTPIGPCTSVFVIQAMEAGESGKQAK
jgi:hypothetical protein